MLLRLARGVARGLSRMKGNFHVRFLGEVAGNAASLPGEFPVSDVDRCHARGRAGDPYLLSRSPD